MPLRIAVAALAFAILFTARAARALTPDQIAVIVNGNSPASREVADHYVKARGIPRSHVITVAVKPGDDISEPDYRLQIVLPIRKALVDRKLDTTVTCLVTTTDIPLRVGAQPINPADEVDILADRKQLAETRQELYAAIAKYEAILAAGGAASRPAAATTTAPAGTAAASPPDPPPLPKVLSDLQAAVNQAAGRVNRAGGAARAAALDQFVKLQDARSAGPA